MAIDSVASQGAEYALNAGMQEVKAFSTESELIVQNKARVLLDYVKFIQAKQNSVLSQISENNVIELPRKMIKSQQEYMEVMKRVYDFQNSIMDFLGQKMEMVYVYIGAKGKKIELYKIGNDAEHLSISKTASSRGGIISGRYGNKIRKSGTLLDYNTYDPNLSGLNPTFSEVYERYLKSKERIKQGGAAYILWRQGNKYNGVKITGAGVLGEAYVGFFIHEYYFKSSNVEDNVRNYMLNNLYGAIKVDATSGFLQGDIVKGNINYGVKAKGASAMGYSEIIQYANEILAIPQGQLQEYLTGSQGLQGRLSSEGEKIKLATKLKEAITLDADELVDDLEAALNKLSINLKI